VDILIYTHEFPPQIGGAGAYSYELAKHLSQLGKKVIVFTRLYNNAENLKFDKRQSFKIIRLRFISRWKINYVINTLVLMCLLVRYTPKNLLISEHGSQQVMSYAAFFIPKRYLVLAHGSEVLVNFYKRNFAKKFFRRFYEKAKRIISISQYTKNLLVGLGFPEEKITVIHPGINTALFMEETNESHVLGIKQRYGLTGRKVLLTLARLDPRKGQDMVIRALPLVKNFDRDIAYLICGEGKDRPRLEKIVAACQVKDNVFFVGVLSEDQKILFFDACDIFIQPSRQAGNWVEGFGITFLEAAIRRKPIIAGNHGGVPEAVLDGTTGLLVNPTNPQEIAGAIIKLLKDEAAAAKLGERARERCLQEFDWTMVAEKFIGLLEK